jgi:hypothetical protein
MNSFVAMVVADMELVVGLVSVSVSVSVEVVRLE